jgi:hypothetical protein
LPARPAYAWYRGNLFANAARMIFFDKLMEETEEIGRNAHKRAGECH